MFDAQQYVERWSYEENVTSSFESAGKICCFDLLPSLEVELLSTSEPASESKAAYSSRGETAVSEFTTYVPCEEDLSSTELSQRFTSCFRDAVCKDPVSTEQDTKRQSLNNICFFVLGEFLLPDRIRLHTFGLRQIVLLS